MMSTTNEAADLLAVAKEAAVVGSNLCRQMFSNPLQITSKGFRDLVTDADVATQKAVTDLILKRFPDHGFMVEEDCDLSDDGEVIWIIDPIDGTTNYSHSIPVYCVSIAAFRRADGKPLAGVIYDPMREELFSAAAGLGAWLNDLPMRVSTATTLGDSLVAVDWSHDRETGRSAADVIPQVGERSFSLRAFGSAALAMAWVAAGRLDAYVNFSLRPWDIAAGQILVAEAGGLLTKTTGQPWLPFSEDRSSCIMTNGLVHSELLSLL